MELSSSVSSTGPEWDGTAGNLSRQGCAIHSTTPVQKGDRLHVLIQFGVEFMTLAPGEAIRLENLLAIIGKG